MNLHSLIVLFGGGFILYTSIKEIWHMIIFEINEVSTEKKSSSKVIWMIVLMNLIFSFDSILSAMADRSINNYGNINSYRWCFNDIGCQ